MQLDIINQVCSTRNYDSAGEGGRADTHTLASPSRSGHRFDTLESLMMLIILPTAKLLKSRN